MSPRGAELPPAEGGVLLVDKRAGHTSHDVVAGARRTLGIRRIGHTGTLDPFATGLLLLCIGAATRLVEYFHRLSKTYDATLRLGQETTTHDPEGDVCRRSEAWRELRREDVEKTLRAHVGRLEQRPPDYSAKRVGGRRAHRVARGGGEPSLAPVPVHVHQLEATDFRPPELRLRARVSTGTYVRALARDLGRALGCGAHLTALRRTEIGPFRVEDALAEDRLEEARPEHRAWLSPSRATAWLPRRELDEEEADDVRHGRPVPARGAGDDGLVALVRGDRLVAVAERREDVLQPRKVFVAR